MSVLWTFGVRTGRLTMNEFVAVTSTNIAKILHMYPRKGAIMAGADADIVVWDPEATKTISAKTQKSAIDYNVFEGINVTGRPKLTLSRGRVAYEEGDVKAEHRRRPLRGAPAVHAGAQGALHLEGADRPAQGGAHGHSGGGVSQRGHGSLLPWGEGGCEAAG